MSHYRLNQLSVVDTASNAVIATISVGTAPHGITTSANGAYAYVANSGDGTVSVIDTNTLSVGATTPAGANARRVAFLK